MTPTDPTADGSNGRAGWRDGERDRLLPRLLPVSPADLADASAAGRRRVLDLMMRALRSERRRGRSGHWSYSLARHAGLVEAIDAELASWRDEGRVPPHFLRAGRPAGREDEDAAAREDRGVETTSRRAPDQRPPRRRC